MLGKFSIVLAQQRSQIMTLRHKFTPSALALVLLYFLLINTGSKMQTVLKYIDKLMPISGNVLNSMQRM